MSYIDQESENEKGVKRKEILGVSSSCFCVNSYEFIQSILGHQL